MTSATPSRPPYSPAPQPWVRNEAGSIDAMTQELLRARTTIAAVIADLNRAVATTHWMGPDADQLRREWNNRRLQLEELQAQISRLAPLLQQRAQTETQRFRKQAMGR